ncbi:XRE family transcriptional regulator [Carboxylicivirga marina]|uniref:Helix-turn-helix transcriptional regulator n=1 Tax=Carboxylicivirga marina TaxID=2800988 RepID=A0ABS1HGF6_9BACT|nr:helix-turn-helix transcriptional regulator [Carboxylicivirga marina]MBK3516676.1 helix-turn-helix transcriptional regulator [Carboxylicivirga marina]
MLKIKEIRKQKKLTQDDVAKLSGIPKRSYVGYENGTIQPPAHRLQDIAHALDVGVNELIGASLKGSSKAIGKIPEPTVYYGPTGNEYKEMENGRYKVSVPLVQAHAYARYLTDYQASDLHERFEYVDFVVDMIGKGKYYAFEIKGDSMDDDSKRSIPHGSTVLARDVKSEYWKDKLNFKKFPYWIIVHENSILCKEVIAHDVEKGIIKCHSLNDSPEYSDFEVNLREVKQLLNIVKVQQDVNFY